MNYTKGETAGGWIHIHSGKMPIALVHPKHVDKFLAAPDMYEALKEITETSLNADTLRILSPWLEKVLSILDKAEGK